MNNKSQKIDLEILFALAHHSTKYPQILQNFFFDWSIDIDPKSHRLK